MKIERITIEFGMTQSVGDYSNVRPEVELTAVLDENDDPAWVLAHLRETAVEVIHKMVDDELESTCREPKYYTGPLYSVSYATKRGLVVIHPAGAELPAAENWQERDPWRRYYNAPEKMRLETAMTRATMLVRDRHYDLLACHQGNYGDIPGLPDPGPEPQWHKKDLSGALLRLRVPEEQWEDIASLPHVDKDFLRAVYDNFRIQGLEACLPVIRDPLQALAYSDEEE